MRWVVYPVVFAAFGLTAFAGVALKQSGMGREAPHMLAEMAEVVRDHVAGAEAGSVVIYKTTPGVALPYPNHAAEPYGQDAAMGCRIGICQDV